MYTFCKVYFAYITISRGLITYYCNVLFNSIWVCEGSSLMLLIQHQVNSSSVSSDLSLRLQIQKQTLPLGEM